MPAAGSNPLVSRPPTGTQPRPRTSASRPEARSRPDTSSSQQRAPDESALRLSQALGKAADQASRAALVSASLTMFPFPPSRKYNLAQIACALRARSCNACKPPPRARWVAVVVVGGGGWGSGGSPGWDGGPQCHTGTGGLFSGRVQGRALPRPSPWRQARGLQAQQVDRGRPPPALLRQQGKRPLANSRPADGGASKVCPSRVSACRVRDGDAGPALFPWMKRLRSCWRQSWAPMLS
jgi:hypothetical protein